MQLLSTRSFCSTGSTSCFHPIFSADYFILLQKGVGLHSLLLMLQPVSHAATESERKDSLRVVARSVGPVSEEQPAHCPQSLEKDGPTSSAPGDRAEQHPPQTHIPQCRGTLTLDVPILCSLSPVMKSLHSIPQGILR